MMNEAAGITIQALPCWNMASFIASATSPCSRGLHSFASQLNLSAFYGERGCAQGLCSSCYGVVRGCLGCVKCFECVRHGSS